MSKTDYLQTVALVAALCTTSLAQSHRREYAAPFVSQPIVVDGILAEAAWDLAPWTDSYVLYGTLENPARTMTRAKIAWDSEYLYVGVLAEDEDIWSTYTDHDSELWNEDVLEVFMDPEGDAEGYLEFEVSPLNTVLDLWVEKPLFSQGGPSHFAWNAVGLRTAVHVDGSLGDDDQTKAERGDTDREWSMELALPWADATIVSGTMALPPNPGDTWRMNVTRYDYSRGSGELSQWSPSDVKGAWHEPREYGYVTFVRTSTSVNLSTWGTLKQQRGH